MTDRRCIFVDKKSIMQVPHIDIDTLEFSDCANCYMNGDYSKSIINVSGKSSFHGALIAMIVLMSFEADNDREKIRII